MSALSRLLSIHGVLRPTSPTSEGAPEPYETIAMELPANPEDSAVATPVSQKVVGDFVEIPQGLNESK